MALSILDGGFANIVLKLDQNGETSVELEESFAQTTSLPANLQLKAGQYFAAFGQANVQHPAHGRSSTSRSSSGAPGRTAWCSLGVQLSGWRRRRSTRSCSSA